MNNRNSGNRVRQATRTAWRRAWYLPLTVMAWSLCANAIAQQSPLTGEMLDGDTPAPAAAATRTAQPAVPKPEATTPQPATTYATAAARDAQAATTATDMAASAPAHPAQPPMPDYTRLTAPLAMAPPTTDSTRTPPFGTPVGNVTHYLLQMQAGNQHAVASLPTLGDEASAAYQRYLQSFHQPIPVFFQTMVESDSGTNP